MIPDMFKYICGNDLIGIIISIIIDSCEMLIYSWTVVQFQYIAECYNVWIANIEFCNFLSLSLAYYMSTYF